MGAGLVLMRTGNAFTPASKTSADATRHIVLPGRTGTLPYGDGVLVRDTLNLAGRIGIDPQTGKPPEDVEKGFCPRFFVRIFPCTRSSKRFFRTYFSKNFPARAFIGSGPLLRGGRFEVLGIAVRR
jgi:enamine deaminase RidA (YjgF/YER057c/UK114 family)